MNLHTCCGCSSTPVFVHDGRTLSHLCFALVGDGLALGFAGGGVGGMVDGAVDAAADGFADDVYAY